ncbi:MAG TPA: toll/interleukin-1 receptor domain-containing protein [Chloroflexia bacterium]|nr:toll/interleukin-1 receptor domain-containing protein [Chloroflexia bacterium]
MTEALTFAQWFKRRSRELGISVKQLHRLLILSVSSIEKVLRGDPPSKGFALEVAHLFAIPDDQRDAFVEWARGEGGLPSSGAVDAEIDGTAKAQSKADGPIRDRMPWLDPPAGHDSIRVFLCHASEDKPTVRDVYFRVRAAGFSVWLDEEDLLPGQDWRVEIPRAVKHSDVVLVCLSKRAVTKAGYVQKELGSALDIAEEQPEGTIYLIPVRLEECEVPNRLEQWQRVDLFSLGSQSGYSWQGYRKLFRALRERARQQNQ